MAAELRASQGSVGAAESTGRGTDGHVGCDGSEGRDGNGVDSPRGSDDGDGGHGPQDVHGSGGSRDPVGAAGSSTDGRRRMVVNRSRRPPRLHSILPSGLCSDSSCCCPDCTEVRCSQTWSPWSSTPSSDGSEGSVHDDRHGVDGTHGAQERDRGDGTALRGSAGGGPAE